VEPAEKDDRGRQEEETEEVQRVDAQRASVPLGEREAADAAVEDLALAPSASREAAFATIVSANSHFAHRARPVGDS
jgi:hypothetical protein